MRIRAITLWEPWASLVAIGAKTYETRSWAPGHRGLLAIHAAKRWRQDQEELLWRPPYMGTLSEAGFDVDASSPFALGCVVAVVRLLKIFKAELVRERLQMRQLEGEAWASRELAFGDYRAERYAWRLEVVQRLQKPVPAKGARGLWWWDVPARLAKRLEKVG